MKRLIKDYLLIENQFTDLRDRKTPPLSNLESYRNFPALPQFIKTISDVNIHSLYDNDLFNEHSALEWNPFFQRLPIVSFGNHTNTQKTFHLMHHLAQSVLLMVHEAYHLFALEPFFSGNLNFEKYADFKNFMLLNEAFCFWISDLIAAQEMQLRYPNNELIFNRSGISEPHFNPWHTLKNIGVKNKTEALDIYLRAFTSHETPLINGKSADCLALKNRFYLFDSKSPSKVKSFYTELRTIGVFSEFYDRFCIPARDITLLSLRPVDLSISELIKYFKSFKKTSDLDLSKIKQDMVKKVKQRRKIQTAAYSAYSLLSAISRGRTTIPEKYHRAIRKNIEIYLDQLELAINTLAASRLASKKIFNEANIFYSINIKGTLINSDAYMTQILRILPEADSSLLFKGILSLNTNFKSSEIQSLRRFLLKLGNRSINNSKCFDKVSEALSLVCKLSIEKNSANRRTINKINNILLSGPVIGQWSIFLGSIDPECGNYREILFKYV